MQRLSAVGVGALIGAAVAWLIDNRGSKMPAVQQQFDDFHASIKLDNDDEKAKLREKRDTLVQALRDNLGEDVPSFLTFNQGSYSMHTGVLPPGGNYDIDVGIVFDCKRDRYSDPVVLKKKVRDALNSNGRTVTIRRSCVTVNYMRGNDVAYHVDLALYVMRDDGLLDLAKGKENSERDKRVWELSDPKGLTNSVCTAFSKDDELAQFRRCVRYLKRWRSVQFANGGAPLSISLTIAAKDWFKPRMNTSGRPDDLLAMLAWVDALVGQFLWTSEEGGHYRLKVQLPVTPHSDLMAGMTKFQMELFRTKLEALRDALDEAYDEDLPEDACKRLSKQFGDDFKVPAKAETARAVSAPVIGTGNSA
jgi:hypothetical protein